MKKSYLFFLLPLFIFLLATTLFSQYRNRFEITGFVFDASTGESINYANVFLANTTRGDATDESGEYIITNIPPGTYELIATMMGYEIQKKVIQVYGLKSKVFIFHLKPKILQGEEITVTAKNPKEWRKNLKIFERIYFGKKEFAKKCELKNPEVLDFKYDRKTGKFNAISEGALVLINNALGYEVTLFLEEFYVELFNNDDIYIIEGKEEWMTKSIRNGAIRCKSTNYFKELKAKDDKQKKEWVKNRLIAYNGSMRHFFNSLINGSYKDEGFKVCGFKDDSGRNDYTLNIKEILKPSDNDYHYILTFPDLLKVIYAKEKDEVNFEIGMEVSYSQHSFSGRSNYIANQRIRYANQTSWINILAGKDILLNYNGIVIPNGTEYGCSGYWFWDRPVESLPEDYNKTTNLK